MTYGAVAYASGPYAGPTGVATLPTAGAVPIVALEVAFTTDPGAATPTWTDISAYLEGELATFRGRSMETETYRTGTLELTLQNEDRRFDPANTAGPYYPNVVPMRRVRARATYAGTTYDLFSGYVDSWDQSYEHPSVAHCRVQASDAFKVLNQIQLPSSAYAAEVIADSPVSWYRLGEAQGATTIRDSVGTNHLNIELSPSFGVAGLVTRETDTAALFSTTDTGAQRTGNPTVPGAPMTVEFIYANIAGSSGVGIIGEVATSYGAGNIPVSGWVVDFFAGGMRFQVLTATGAGAVQTTTSPTADTSPHHYAFTWAADGTLRAFYDGVLQATSSVAPGTFASSAVEIMGAGRAVVSGTSAFTGTYDEIAVYNTALSPTRVAAHASARATAWSGEQSGARINRLLDAAGWPAADRQIDTGSAVLQGADLGTSALSALQKVEETEQGRLFVTNDGKVRFVGRDRLIQAPYTVPAAVFGDSGTELEYGDLQYRYDDTTIANEVTVSRADGVAQTARDLTSQTKYLRRSMVIDGLLHQSDTTSLDLANWKLNHYKDPLLRATSMRLEPDAGNDTTHYPQVLGRELVERVTVRRRPQQVGAAIDQDTQLESVAHHISRGVHWNTEWNLSPADTVAVGVWDATTALWDQARWGF